MSIRYVAEPASQTWEKLIDERGITIDHERVYKYKPMFDENTDGKMDYYNVLKGIYNETLLSRLFFSHANIKHLDRRLRYTVYLMSKKQYNLSPQNFTELVIIMRSIYLNYSVNLKTHIKNQIERLNNIVIKAVAPDLLARTTQYLKYLEDANEAHKVLLARPLNVSGKGMKVLQTSTAFRM